MGLQIRGNENTTKLANLLKASSNQYPTLSKEEEKAMIRKYAKDRDKLNQLLVMHNLRAVFSFAKKYSSKTHDFDALIQDGFRGLSEAAQKFDTRKNIKFITYGYWYIRKYVLENFNEKKNRLYINSVSMNAPNQQLAKSKSVGTNSEVTLENCIDDYIEPSVNRPKTIENILSSDEQQQICKELLENLEKDSSLSSSDRNMFIDYFYNNEKTQDIADKYSTDKQYVVQNNQKILKKLRTMMTQNFQIQSFDDIMM